MKKKIAIFVPVAAIVAATSMFAFSGCGNGWFDSKERMETPSALMFEGQKAYDAEEYTRATDLFRQAVKKDPNNVNARVGLAFALNGEAGLSLSQVMHDIIAADQEKSATGSDTTNLAGDSKSSGFLIFKALGVNFDKEANKPFLTALETFWASAKDNAAACKAGTTSKCEIEVIKEYSKKVRKLIQSFQVVCPLIDPAVLALIKADPTSYRVLLNGSDKTCRGGMKGGNGAAAFAAAIGLLGQTAVEWTLLDHKTYNSSTKTFGATNEGDGKPDMLGTLEASFGAITTARNAMTPQNIDATLSLITEKTTDLDNNIARMELDAFRMLIKNVKVITTIVTTSLKLDDSTTKKFDEVEKQVDAAIEQISSYKKTTVSGGTTGAATPAETQQKAVTAAKDIEAAIAQKVTTNAPVDPAQEAKICSNFSSLTVQAGLPATTQPPCNCKATAAEQAACCKSKSAINSAERQNCCKSAFKAGAGDPEYDACVAAAQGLVGDDFELATTNLESGTSDETETQSIVSSRDQQLLAILELFQSADRTWRGER